MSIRCSQLCGVQCLSRFRGTCGETGPKKQNKGQGLLDVGRSTKGPEF